MSFLSMIFGRKCCLCGDGENLSRVQSYFAYSKDYYDYHYGCLQTVLNNPELWGHQMVDTAIDLEQCIAHRNKMDAERISRAKQSAGRLRT